MKFFIPAAETDAEADVILESIAKFIQVQLPERRIYKLTFMHNGVEYSVEVGQPAPNYFQADGPVIAILGDDPLCICLPERGVIRGSPIYVGRLSVKAIEYFDYELEHLRGEV